MTELEKIQKRLAQPDLVKFKDHRSIYTLTDDERKRVLKKHRNFRRYFLLKSAEMRIIAMQLSDALYVGTNVCKLEQGTALQVESLEATLKHVTYNDKYLKLYRIKN